RALFVAWAGTASVAPASKSAISRVSISRGRTVPFIFPPLEALSRPTRGMNSRHSMRSRLLRSWLPKHKRQKREQSARQGWNRPAHDHAERLVEDVDDTAVVAPGHTLTITSQIKVRRYGVCG